MIKRPVSRGKPSTISQPLCTLRLMAVGDPCANETCAETWGVPKNRRVPKGQRKYCSERCQVNTQQRNYKRRVRGTKEVNFVPKITKSPLYDKAVELGIADALVLDKLPVVQAAEMLNCSVSMVFRIRAIHDRALREAALAEKWQPEEWALGLLDDFAEFRSHFFETKPGVPFVTKDFHAKWIEATEKTMNEGGQLVILSPPRHGKTELLIHFCLWQIMKNPDIHIMWIGKNERQAKKSVMSVMDHLQSNATLKEFYLPPGAAWKPEKRGGSMWSANEFHVDNQSVVGDKAPTMRAVGRAGQILSSDVDLIIADDIEDHGSVNQPHSREETRSWWTTQVGSRIESQTAQVVIGSRQHPEDLYQHLIDNPGWDFIIEQAHLETCELDPGTLAIHQSCMLWPEKNSYEWLMNRRIAAETTGGLATFEMVYQNRTKSAMSLIFNKDDVEACYNHNRAIGQIPPGTYRIAGLDPATSGYQASFLWAMDFNADPPKQYMIDTENEAGGGMVGASRIIKEWFAKYQVAHWVIEENGWQKAIRKDRDLREWCQNNGVRLDGHETYKNKWDDRMGVTKMQDLFAARQIDFPYLGAEAQQKTDLVARQLAGFSRDGQRTNARRGYQSDLVMAMWFPQKKWHQEMQIQLADMGVDYAPVYAGYQDLEVVW